MWRKIEVWCSGRRLDSEKIELRVPGALNLFVWMKTLSSLEKAFLLAKGTVQETAGPEG